MKRLIAAVVLFSLNMSFASAAEVKVKEVVYDSSEQKFTVIADVKNMCNAELLFRVRGCTDLVVPYSCFIDIKADGGDDCGKDSMAIANVYLEDLDLYKKEMSGGTITFQNEKGKTRKSIQLSVLK